MKIRAVLTLTVDYEDESDETTFEHASEMCKNCLDDVASIAASEGLLSYDTGYLVVDNWTARVDVTKITEDAS